MLTIANPPIRLLRADTLFLSVSIQPKIACDIWPERVVLQA